MGPFDFLFAGDKDPKSPVPAGYVSACHILLRDEAAAEDIQARIESKELSFEDAAQQYSICPSGNKKKGNLGNVS